MTFYRAQELLVVNSHKSGRVRAGEKFILSGKVVCSHCGALYNGESGTCRNGDVHYFYKCRRKKEGKDKCCSHAVLKQVFEDSVYKTIMTALKDETFLHRVAEQAVEIHNRQITEKPELKILRRQLAETEEMLNNITMAICKGIFNDYTQNKMTELTLLKTQLVAKIADEEANNIKPLHVEMLMDFFHKSVLAIECAEDPTNLDKRKKLFDALIKQIIFDGEKYLSGKQYNGTSYGVPWTQYRFVVDRQSTQKDWDNLDFSRVVRGRYSYFFRLDRKSAGYYISINQYIWDKKEVNEDKRAERSLLAKEAGLDYIPNNYKESKMQVIYFENWNELEDKLPSLKNTMQIILKHNLNQYKEENCAFTGQRF